MSEIIKLQSIFTTLLDSLTHDEVDPSSKCRFYTFLLSKVKCVLGFHHIGSASGTKKNNRLRELQQFTNLLIIGCWTVDELITVC